MLFGKYINKYYIRYLFFFLIGIAALVAVDFAQLQIAPLVGKITNLFNEAATTEGGYHNVPGMEKEVTKIISTVLIIAGTMFLGRILWRLTIFHASQHIEANIRHDMFLKAERLPVSYYHETKVGNVMAWFTNDIETIEEFFGWGTIMMVDAIFLSLLTIIYMAILSWQLMILTLIPMLLIIVWGALVEKFMSMHWELRQKTYDELYDFSQETFTGIRVIKAFVKENQQLHAFAKVAKKNKDVNITFGRLSVIFDVLIEAIIAMISAFLLGFGGWFVLAAVNDHPINLFGVVAKLKVDQLITYLIYYDTLIWPLIAMGQVVSMHSRARASLKRITLFLDSPETLLLPENPVYLSNCKGKIEFRDFSFRYPDANEPYLRNISFTIHPGERIGIVGKIGCGKTTIANTLLRLYNIGKGQIFIDDVDLMDIDIKSLRDAIAYVPQDNFLFSDSIRRNIAFSNVNENETRIRDAARFSDVDDDIQGFLDKYDTITGERGVTLSGGQKQRISIARAYVKGASILIMDDSVSAVDLKTEEEILKNIHDKRGGKTTLIVASRVSTVSHCDKILVLNKGQLEAFDTPENLLKKSETYKKMVYLQQLEREAEGGN